MADPLKVFISYSHNKSDRPLLDQLLRQLAPLVRAGKITCWEDSQILPGKDWATEIRTNLSQAHIVLFLVSSDYFASDYVNNIEVPLAMQRQAVGECTVVPVLLRSCLFELAPYVDYEFLPKTPHDQRLVPVENWARRDEALDVVVRRLYQLVLDLSPAAAAAVTSPASSAPAPAPPSMTSPAAPPSLPDPERTGDQRLLTLATDKRQRLQTAHLLETDAARRFAYEQQIQELETQIADLKSRLQP